ncbi:SpoIVB peptidase [Butyricicoccus sp. Marseille-Q5471]|uniref:SpoIVB peptidase n=1 Tax=Butyricicoccus sp. Marseille-Q5471 TaxID=3039493 RepID=UPI0024BD5BCE|nr:SpoIVB peptidase [Butyricicoccus sp. Marseille-Q5471]
MKQRMQKRIAISLFLVLSMLFTAQATDITSLIPIGHTVGIKMTSEGVLVVRLNEVTTSNGSACPARDAGVEEGDMIVKVNGQEVDSNDSLQKQIALSAGNPVTLSVVRNGSEQTITATPCADENGVFRIGVLARDSMAGIGTLTYVDPETGAYGSLGHGICESETGVLLPLKEGGLLYSTVGSVQKGKVGEPGALQGEFDVERSVGTVTENTQSGIFGTLSDSSMYASLESVPVASSDEIKLGSAEIMANIEGDSVKKYAVEVVKLYPEDDEYGRGMMLRVTDETLIAKTGGIVQGMSGSPVLQNGKIIGAVTHVLVNDPTCGYAIDIQKMLDEMEN